MTQASPNQDVDNANLGTPAPKLINLNADDGFVSIGSVTTAQENDPIQTNNPFSNDTKSSRLFQSISTPNEVGFRRKVIESVRKTSSAASENHQKQTSGESGETLVAKMLISEEGIASPTYLRCRTVKAVEPDSFKVHEGDGHKGVRAIVTNKRLLLVDSSKNTVHKITPARTPSTFLSPPRPGESFSIQSSISDDVWFKAIPLRCVTGLEVLSSHMSESYRLVSNNRHPLWFTLLIAGALLLFLSITSGPLMIILGLISIVSSLIVFSTIARPKTSRTRSEVYKERTVSIGFYDTVYNRPLILEIELEDTQNLSLAYEWCRVLQQYAPNLSSDSPPIILR